MAQLLSVKNNVLKGGKHYLTSDYKTRNKGRSSHNGMDLVGANGRDDIIAYASGKVNYIGYDKTSGHWISIKTNDYEHRYFHLDGTKIYVKKGDNVVKGQTIAYMGKSGNATGYCLHFAIYKGGYVDPKPYLMGEKGEISGDIPKDDTYTTFVKDVQRSIGANVDGKAGPETLSKTITISKTTNRRHGVVRPIQVYLASLGYDLGSYGVDGCIGNDMVKVIKQFQKDNGCVADGVITARQLTWKKLLKLA